MSHTLTPFPVNTPIKTITDQELIAILEVGTAQTLSEKERSLAVPVVGRVKKVRDVMTLGDVVDALLAIEDLKSFAAACQAKLLGDGEYYHVFFERK